MLVGSVSAGAGEKVTESNTLNVMQEQAVERVRICHCKAHKGIRANGKQAYAGI